MRKEVNILTAEADEVHASLIRENLRKAGISNPIIRFKTGRELLDYLFENTGGAGTGKNKSNLLLLDLRIPQVNGEEVLRRIKADDELKKMSVIILTDSDDPAELEKCNRLGCSSCLTKPVVYEKFVEAIKKLGLFLMIVEVPTLKCEPGVVEE